MQILIVEDDVRLARALAHILEENGYGTDVVHDGATGLAWAESGRYDVIVLDVMLPKKDGFSVAADLRRAGVSTPVLLLTARDAVPDKITGFDSGADDYMTKPFGVLELSARIRTLLRRRSKAPVTEDVISQDIISVDRKTREVTVDGAKVELTLKEFELLTYLLENKARVVTREELLNHIWGYDYDGETRTLDMHIRTLRQKLGAEAGAMVKTIRGVGYRLLKRGEV